MQQNVNFGLAHVPRVHNRDGLMQPTAAGLASRSIAIAVGKVMVGLQIEGV